MLPLKSVLSHLSMFRRIKRSKYISTCLIQILPVKGSVCRTANKIINWFLYMTRSEIRRIWKYKWHQHSKFIYLRSLNGLGRNVWIRQVEVRNVRFVETLLPWVQSLQGVPCKMFGAVKNTFPHLDQLS